MSLKVELKPGEKIIIGESVITNGDQRTRLLIDGRAPILRQKDILTPDIADTPAKRIYLAVQIMYLDGPTEERRQIYFELSKQFAAAVPSSAGIIADVNNEMLTDRMYSALKVAKRLIEYEKALIENATSGSSSVPKNASGYG